MPITWVLCNICFIRIIESEAPFHLTNCGHIFCTKCVHKSRCPICNAQDIQLRRVSKPLDTSVGDLFGDVEEAIEDVLRAIKWKKYQLSFLERQQREMTRKCVQLEAAYNKIHEKDKLICAEYEAIMKAYMELTNSLNTRATRKVHFTNDTFGNASNFIYKRENRNVCRPERYPGSPVDYFNQCAAASRGIPDVRTPGYSDSISTPRTSDYSSAGSGRNYYYHH